MNTKELVGKIGDRGHSRQNIEIENNIVDMFSLNDPIADALTKQDLKTAFPVSGEILVKHPYEFICDARMPFRMCLSCAGDEESIAEFDTQGKDLAEFLEFTEGNKRCTFHFPDHWRTKLDDSRLGTSLTVFLKLYFFLKVRNTSVVGEERELAFTIYSTQIQEKVAYKHSGTALYIPPVSIRWG